MRLREAIAVSAATASFMLIAQPERLWNVPADALVATSSFSTNISVQDPPSGDRAGRPDDHRRGNGRRSGGRSRLNQSNGFVPFEPLPDPEEFNAELVALCIEVARDVNPDLADRLRTLCDEDPDEFEEIMRTRASRVLGLAMLKARSPELYGLRMQDMLYEQQAEELARRMRQAVTDADATGAAEYERQLRNILEMKFALSLKARYDYLQLMEQHLESMRQSIEDDASRFKELIDEQVAQYKSPPRRRWDRSRSIESIDVSNPDRP